MQVLDQAAHQLEQSLRVPAQKSWKAAARQQLDGLDQALTDEHTGTRESWLHARARRLHRERNHLRRRLDRLRQVLDDPAADQPLLRADLLRLARDIAHHHQRVNDLAYDAAGRDVGGSE